MLLLPVTANVLPSSLILFTLIMEAMRSSETSVLAGATLRDIPENSIFLIHCRQNLESYKATMGWAV
jgi:hypothetical protein